MDHEWDTVAGAFVSGPEGPRPLDAEKASHLWLTFQSGRPDLASGAAATDTEHASACEEPGPEVPGPGCRKGRPSLIDLSVGAPGFGVGRGSDRH